MGIIKKAKLELSSIIFDKYILGYGDEESVKAYEGKTNHLEREGDIEDLYQLNSDCLSQTHKMSFPVAIRVFDFIKISYTIISHNELDKLEGEIKNFRTAYPDLYNTLLVWAYG